MITLTDLLDMGYIETDSTVGDALIYPAEGYQVYVDGSILEYASVADKLITLYDQDDEIIYEVGMIDELPCCHVFAITKTKVL